MTATGEASLLGMPKGSSEDLKAIARWLNPAGSPLEMELLAAHMTTGKSDVAAAAITQLILLTACRNSEIAGLT